MLIKPQSRREFLKKSAVVTAGTLLLPSFLQASPWENTSGKRLVVVQFSGGNDGLNTIVPFRNDILLKSRPNLRLNNNELLKVSDELAFNAALTDFRTLYDNGDVCIINNVGYPNPNRSHFRSMDIWHTASDAHVYGKTGWLGRYLDNECKGEPPVTAVEMNTILSMAMKGKTKKGIPVSNVQQFYQASKQIRINHPHHHDNELASYLYKTIADTKSSAKYLYEKHNIYQSKIQYPDGRFAKDLKGVAEMILSNVESPIYYTNLSGFDTHNNQKERQSRLLTEFSQGIGSFAKELKAAKEWDNTLVLVFSEFGRRVKENASKGTDHGKANNVLLIGGALKQAGLYNALAKLSQLDEGDIPFEIDFRQIYTTILQNWLKTDSSKILRKDFPVLSFV